jgi:hypothetical protein
MDFFFLVRVPAGDCGLYDIPPFIRVSLQLDSCNAAESPACERVSHQAIPTDIEMHNSAVHINRTIDNIETLMDERHDLSGEFLDALLYDTECCTIAGWIQQLILAESVHRKLHVPIKKEVEKVLGCCNGSIFVVRRGIQFWPK